MYFGFKITFIVKKIECLSLSSYFVKLEKERRKETWRKPNEK